MVIASACLSQFSSRMSIWPRWRAFDPALFSKFSDCGRKDPPDVLELQRVGGIDRLGSQQLHIVSIAESITIYWEGAIFEITSCTRRPFNQIIIRTLGLCIPFDRWLCCCGFWCTSSLRVSAIVSSQNWPRGGAIHGRVQPGIRLLCGFTALRFLPGIYVSLEDVCVRF